MKKIVALLVCLVCFFGGFAIAEVKFNADDYTLQELTEIYSIISEKLNDYVLIPEGYYVVGKDLPAGKFSFLYYEDVEEENLESSIIAIFNNLNDYKAEIDIWPWLTEESKNVYLCLPMYSGLTCELSEGMVIGVGCGKAAIRKVETGIFSTFWN